MALVLDDRVKETSTTTGTGTLNLSGAVSGFQTFVAGVGDGNTTYYAIVNRDEAEWETGLGTVTDATTDTLARTTVIASSNSDSAVDFSAGTKDVFTTLPASKVGHLDGSNDFIIGRGASGVDYSLKFDGETSDGVITWMEDEDHLKIEDDVVVDSSKRIYFYDEGGEYIYGDGTDLYLTSGADINIPANIGLTFGNDGEKIEGDGTDLTISANNLNIDAAADINLDAGGADVVIKDDGTAIGKFTNSSSDFVITSSVQDKDIIFKGDDGGSAITALTLDMSAAGAATFNDKIVATELDISGNVDVDGTLEADAYTVDGTALATYIRDTVGTNMLSSNTETGIAVTYDTSNDNIDFALEAAQTVFTSILNSSLVVGYGSSDANIDFSTDNAIIFDIDGTQQIKLQDGALVPITDNDIDLGTNSLEFKDAYFDGTVEADAITVGGTNVVTAGADTSLTSIYNTSLALGYGASHANIDFSTDNAIIFDIDGTQQIKLQDGALVPITDNDIDLGTNSLEFKNAYFDGTVEADAITIGGTAVTAGGATAGFALAMAVAL